MCSILFLLQFIILRSPLIFPRDPAGMAGHLYNLLYTNPLAIFCQINMTVASYLILPPCHTTAIPPTLQHGVVIPPLYIVCHMHATASYCMLLMHCRYCHMRGYCCHFMLYAMHCGYCHMRGYCCRFILYALYTMQCG